MYKNIVLSTLATEQPLVMKFIISLYQLWLVLGLAHLPAEDDTYMPKHVIVIRYCYMYMMLCIYLVVANKYSDPKCME